MDIQDLITNDTQYLISTYNVDNNGNIIEKTNEQEIKEIGYILATVFFLVSLLR